MTTIDPAPLNGSDLPSDAERLGVDADGAVHRYSRQNNTVYVREPDAVVWLAYELDATPCDGPEDWLTHTERVRGSWQETQYSTRGFAGILERAAEGD